jgi:aldehyde:ferredoxin oxidoreductase
MIHAVTGISGDKATLQSIADAVSNVVRQFNLREGLTPADDRLPKGLHRVLKKTGDNLEPHELEYMLKDYYRIRGWDEQGRPAPEDCI